MKRGTPNHPKVAELAESLGVCRAHAIGILELLFHFTAQYAPEGNIGKYSDRRIAAALDWRGKPNISIDKEAMRLIRALIDTGWIDSRSDHRLVTHDWQEHIDRATAQRLSRNGKRAIASYQQDTPKVCTQSETQKCTPPEPEPEPEPVPHPVECVVTHSLIDCAIAQSPSTEVEENGDDPMKPSLLNPPFSTLGRVRKKKAKPTGDSEIAQWFEAEFWPLYPRRICKVSALAAANKRVVSIETRAEIIAGLKAQLPQLSARESEFIPYPSTWLNQERWKDEPEKPQMHVSRHAAKNEEVLTHFRRMMRKEAEKHADYRAESQ